MGEVVSACTSLTLHPPTPPTVHQIVATSTLRVKLIFVVLLSIPASEALHMSRLLCPMLAQAIPSCNVLLHIQITMM